MNYLSYFDLKHKNSVVFMLIVVFALSVFSITGSNLPDNSGTWPGGGGSNPGNLGQDIRTLTSATDFIVSTTPGTAPSNNGTCP